MADCVLIVMELGSEWPGWLSECSGNGPRRVVAVQEEGEALASFTERAQDRTARLLADDGELCLAIVACNDRTDPFAMATRLGVGRSLASAMAGSGGGRLLFTTNQRSGLRVRRCLSSLATDMTDAWERMGVSASVRFGLDARSAKPSGKSGRGRNAA